MALMTFLDKDREWLLALLWKTHPTLNLFIKRKVVLCHANSILNILLWLPLVFMMALYSSIISKRRRTNPYLKVAIRGQVNIQTPFGKYLGKKMILMIIWSSFRFLLMAEWFNGLCSRTNYFIPMWLLSNTRQTTILRKMKSSFHLLVVAALIFTRRVDIYSLWGRKKVQSTNVPKNTLQSIYYHLRYAIQCWYTGSLYGCIHGSL